MTMEGIKIELDRIDKEKKALMEMRKSLDIQFKAMNEEWKEAIEKHDFATCEKCESECKKLLTMLRFVSDRMNELEQASKRVLITLCEPFGSSFMNEILAMIDNMTEGLTEE